MVESSGVWAVVFTGHGRTPRVYNAWVSPGIYLPGTDCSPSPTQLQPALPHWTEREHGPLGWLHPQVGKASLRRSILALAGGHLFCPEAATRETVVSGLLSLRDSSAMAFPGLSGQPPLTVAFWLVPPVPAAALAPKEQVSGYQFSELSRTFLAQDHQGTPQPSGSLGKLIGTLNVPQRPFNPGIILQQDHTLPHNLLLFSVSETLHVIMVALGIEVCPPDTEGCGLPGLGALGLWADGSSSGGCKVGKPKATVPLELPPPEISRGHAQPCPF